MQRIEFTCIILFVLLMVSPNLASAKVYKWVDEKGKAHFTDNPGKIPEQFRTPDKEPQAGKKAKKRGDFSMIFHDFSRNFLKKPDPKIPFFYGLFFAKRKKTQKKQNKNREIRVFTPIKTLLPAPMKKWQKIPQKSGRFFRAKRAKWAR